MKNNRFVLGEQCSPRHRASWCFAATSTGNINKDVYTKEYSATTIRGDDEKLARLSNQDLVAVEARYHHCEGCYSSYVNKKTPDSLSKSKIESVSDGMYFLRPVCN